MSTPIGKHADGTNCYTKNCSRRAEAVKALPPIPTVTLDQFIDGFTGAQRNARYQGYENIITGVKEELDDAHYDAYYSTVYIDLREQLKVNDLAKHPEGRMFVEDKLKEARAAHETEKERLESWTMFADSKTEKLMRTKIEVGMYKRALLNDDDLDVWKDDRYLVAHDSGVGQSETKTAPTIESAIESYKEMSNRLGGHDDTIEGSIVRTNNDGSKSLTVKVSGQSSSIYIGAEPLTQDYFIGDDAAPLIGN